MKLWLIFTHPGGHLVGTLLSSAPEEVRNDEREKKGNRREWERLKGEGWSGEQRQGLWSSYRVYEAASGLVILPHPCPPSLSIIPSTSPWQTGSALYQRATGYLSSFSSFLTQRSSSHLSFALPWSACRDRLSLPGLAVELIGLARRSHQFPQWQHLGSHLMGLGAFANLSTSFGCGACCQVGWSGTWLEGISIGRPILEPWVKSNSKAFAYLTICVLAPEAAKFNAEWLTNRLMC